jgi:hypothetical protein
MIQRSTRDENGVRGKLVANERNFRTCVTVTYIGFLGFLKLFLDGFWKIQLVATGKHQPRDERWKPREDPTANDCKRPKWISLDFGFFLDQKFTKNRLFEFVSSCSFTIREFPIKIDWESVKPAKTGRKTTRKRVKSANSKFDSFSVSIFRSRDWFPPVRVTNPCKCIVAHRHKTPRSAILP